MARGVRSANTRVGTRERRSQGKLPDQKLQSSYRVLMHDTVPSVNYLFSYVCG
jgi:hypothetical protein